MIYLLFPAFFVSGFLAGWAIGYPAGRHDVITKGPTDSEFRRYLSGMEKVTKPRA